MICVRMCVCACVHAVVLVCVRASLYVILYEYTRTVDTHYKEISYKEFLDIVNKFMHPS